MLVQLLFHEMAVAVLADHGARLHRHPDRPVDRLAAGVEHRGAAARQHRPIAVLQVGDAPCHRRQGQAVAAEIHGSVAEADRQRRAVLGADHQPRLVGEHHGQRVGAFQPGKRRPRRIHRRLALTEMEVHQLRHRLGVGFGFEHLAGRFQLGAQLGVVLDDAVMHDADERRAVRVRVALRRRAMGGPAGMTDAGAAG